MKSYKVYRADDADLTYTSNFYSFEEHSLNLLQSKQSVDSDEFLSKYAYRHNKDFITKILGKNKEKNKTGTCKIDKHVPILDEHLFTANCEETKVKVLNSRQKSDLYHFKVMQLKGHEDTGVQSECKVLFHFFFDIFRAKKKEDKLTQFEWDINDKPQ